jgi:hypothetical protein
MRWNLTGIQREAVNNAVALGALATGIVLMGDALLSLIFTLPPYSSSQRWAFAIAGFCFGAAAAVLRVKSRPHSADSSSTTARRVSNIVLVGYLLGIVLPGIRFLTGQANLGWTLVSGTIVIIASAGVALLSARRVDAR